MSERYLCLQIWRNGIVTFGVASSDADVSTPTNNYSMADAMYFVAPLWFKTPDTRFIMSNVSWEEEEEEEEMGKEGNETGYILQFASDAVGNHSLLHFRTAAEFSPTWAVIVNWNITLLPGSNETYDLCRQYRSCLCRISDSGSGPTSGSGSGFDSHNDHDYQDHCEVCYQTGYHCSGCYTEGSGCEISVECFAGMGWSEHDVDYLSALCNSQYNNILERGDGLVSLSLSSPSL